ncbi:transketolase [bacterium]|jgi:transketolase|nr:transketolase [bacterium]MBT6831957.1 transketolase [bacterium]MBT6996653.1 transketolase [bacterium]MBT7773073.1 transketolase [bacterium]
MDFSFPDSNKTLGKNRVSFVQAFAKNCRRSIVKMTTNSQSGHPGGSLSVLDFLSTLYVFRITKTDEKVVISNGHTSPAKYAVLAECGGADRKKVVENFRKFGSKFEGHVTRHVDGIPFGTGPLGVGFSAACGFALAEKKNNSGKRVFCTIGDGEMQEGQVHEAALFAAQQKLENLTVFVDRNHVQISGSIQKVCGLDVSAFFKSKGWKVVEIDGHNFESLWSAINLICRNGCPIAIVGRTVMGNGVPGMEEDGKVLNPKWHGVTAKPEIAAEMLASEKLQLSDEEKSALEDFRADRKFVPKKNNFPENLEKIPDVDPGVPRVYAADEKTDCRSAYGAALLDLAKKNSNILAGSADLSGSVKTDGVEKNLPAQYVEFGICEQNMVSVAGGLSLAQHKNSEKKWIPFVSTFGAFMTSRAKDQARVNDINRCNVKMVSTHCGLSVGEDGPTHQAIDDLGSFVGFFNTHLLEPADPNHCDRLIRFAASHEGNFYVRMGRAKIPVLTRENGAIFFDEKYEYKYGRCDLLRPGSKVTIVASGACVIEALRARDAAKNSDEIEIVITSSVKKFDEVLKKSVEKTHRVITVEDHNPSSGLGAAVAFWAAENGIALEKFETLGVKKYELSGTPAELYRSGKIDADAILEVLKKF